MKKYQVSISDGIYRDAGGSAVVWAPTDESAERQAREWAAAGDWSDASPGAVATVYIDRIVAGHTVPVDVIAVQCI
jgi:hypothetical protein